MRDASFLVTKRWVQEETPMLIAHVIRDKGAVVHTLSADATLEHAAKELNQRRVGALVVLDENGDILGVFSERDLVREVAKRGADALETTVGAAMTREVITAREDETVDDCLARMTDRRVRHLPVLEQEVRLVGIVSIGDLVKHRIAVAEAEAAAMQAYISTH
jgi:CBS domain-containing protein